MSKKKINKAIRVFYMFVGFVLISFLVQCLGGESVSDAYLKKKYIEPKITGKIIDRLMSKGNGLNILIHDKEKQENVSYSIIKENNKFYKNVKTGDFFIKIKNTNKCSIQRGDSILYFDCFDRWLLRKSIQNSMTANQFWKKEKKDYWVKIK